MGTETVRRWAPVAISLCMLLINVGGLLVWGGSINQRVAHLEEHSADSTVHMPEIEKMKFYVTRKEWEKSEQTHGVERGEIRDQMSQLNGKLDTLIMMMVDRKSN